MLYTNERQRLLDGIEALFPADADNRKTALIGEVLLKHALENTAYNWRHLPDEVLERYLVICEDYEQQSAKKQGNRRLPDYLKR